MLGQQPGDSLLGVLLILCLTSLLSGTILSIISPVYGSIPTYHYASGVYVEWVAAACLVFFPFELNALASPVLFQLCATPLILKYFLFPLSHALGPSYGSIISLLITCLPAYLLCCCCFMQVSSNSYILISNQQNKLGDSRPCIVNLARRLTLAIIYCATQVGATRAVSYCIMYAAEAYTHVSKSIVHRSEILHCLAFVYVLLLQKFISRRQLLLAVVILLTSLLAYGDFPLRNHMAMLNGRLSPYGYSVLDAQNSQTGYVSVVENFQDRFRLLRSDHSLLGGTWMPNPERGLYKSESVYPVFNMLEAVKLMERNASVSEAPRNALVIGLGVGTAPSALAAHGIETTVVEIDTAVIEFAKKYFQLHKDIININADAKYYITQAQRKRAKFDYIIHDVFTGGAEPPELFTAEFLRGIRSILKSSGFIAINYAGDLEQPSTLATLQTIRNSFSKCRIFRDSERHESHDKDIINMVAFCGKADEKWSFRRPVEADFLGSESRRQSLPPHNEIDLTALLEQRRAVEAPTNIQDLEAYRLNSALEHWKIMRQVLPSAVWENY